MFLTCSHLFPGTLAPSVRPEGSITNWWITSRSRKLRWFGCWVRMSEVKGQLCHCKGKDRATPELMGSPIILFHGDMFEVAPTEETFHTPPGSDLSSHPSSSSIGSTLVDTACTEGFFEVEKCIKMLNVAVLAKSCDLHHVTMGIFFVVYSSIDLINTTCLSPPSCHSTKKWYKKYKFHYNIQHLKKCKQS